MKWKSFVILVVAALLLSPTACTSDGLVGGECGDGFAYCESSCIPVDDDHLNCGACNNACGRELACVEGLCGGPDGTVKLPDAASGGASLGGGAGDNGLGGINVGAGGPGGRDGAGGGSGGNTGGSGGGFPTGGSGGTPCIPPYDTAARCGACDASCGGGTPNCAPDGVDNFECVANCLVDPFTTECSGACVDVDSNANHCGACGKVCPSGLCDAGMCVGTTYGHMVAMCMNLERQSPGPTNLLANSVFLAAPNPVRILGYTADTSAAARAGTNAALASAAIIKGRNYELTEVTTSAGVTSQLSRTNFDVLLVYDQENATAGELASLGTGWLPAISTFTQVGGVVVVLASAEGTNEMHEFISNIDLFSADSVATADTTRFYVKSPGDAVGINVVSPFLGEQHSCSFDVAGDPFDGELVLVTSDDEAATGNPGVVHKIVVP